MEAVRWLSIFSLSSTLSRALHMNYYTLRLLNHYADTKGQEMVKPMTSPFITEELQVFRKVSHFSKYWIKWFKDI